MRCGAPLCACACVYHGYDAEGLGGKGGVYKSKEETGVPATPGRAGMSYVLAPLEAVCIKGVRVLTPYIGLRLGFRSHSNLTSRHSGAD